MLYWARSLRGLKMERTAPTASTGVALVVASVVDLGLAVLLVGVSGFILQGVNNQGPMMPEAIFLMLMIALCLAAPAAAWLLRARQASPHVVLAIGYAPPAIAVLVLIAEPLFA